MEDEDLRYDDLNILLVFIYVFSLVICSLFLFESDGRESFLTEKKQRFYFFSFCCVSFADIVLGVIEVTEQFVQKDVLSLNCL